MIRPLGLCIIIIKLTKKVKLKKRKEVKMQKMPKYQCGKCGALYAGWAGKGICQKCGSKLVAISWEKYYEEKKKKELKTK